MSEHIANRRMSRRALLTGGAGALTALGIARLAGGSLGGAPARPAVLRAAATNPNSQVVHLAGTDGWVSMPDAGDGRLAPFFPDSLAPAPYNMYVFGFRNVSAFDPAAVTAQRGKAQISAPLLGFDQYDGTLGNDVKVTLTNLGLSQRPDLVDGHTMHWHGFRNAMPLFDGVPELSISVPIGRDFTYYYRPHDPGTYMYHCHFEDVEHVQMGMTGVVFVRPKQNRAPVGADPAGSRYAYNDGDGATRYDREFALLLNELWAEAHWRDAHIQVSDWTDYQPSFWTLNGRCYPDTVEPGGDPMSAAAGRLRYQPNSALVHCQPGERVLLRMANLGYQNHAMTADGIDLTVIAKDANLLVSRDGTRNFQVTNTVDIAPGESRDVLFTAPDVGTYLLYDRNYSYLNNSGHRGYGGQLTEIRVLAPGSLPVQTVPNS